MRRKGAGEAANLACCGAPLGVVEIRGLYDGGAFWSCSRCGKDYRRWPEWSAVGRRVEKWATEHGVTLHAQEWP